MKTAPPLPAAGGENIFCVAALRCGAREESQKSACALCLPYYAARRDYLVNTGVWQEGAGMGRGEAERNAAVVWQISGKSSRHGYAWLEHVRRMTPAGDIFRVSRCWAWNAYQRRARQRIRHGDGTMVGKIAGALLDGEESGAASACHACTPPHLEAAGRSPAGCMTA
jgi:hypothetical protein